MNNILILEDNIDCQNGLIEIISSISSSIITHTAINLHEAEDIINKHNINLFLIDINLDPNDIDDYSGILFARDLRKISQYEFTNIAFITSIDEYELNSYREFYNCKYITKPFDAMSVKTVISNFFRIDNRVFNDNIVVNFKIDGIIYPKNICDILYIESLKRDVMVHLINDSIRLKRCTLNKALQIIDSKDLVQCNRTIVVNRKYIYFVDKINSYVGLTNGEMLDIGRTFKGNF